MIFFFLGLVMSPVGFGLIAVDVNNTVIDVIAEITLILELFTDAARINLIHFWTDHDLPVRMLLIGMPLTILAGVLAAEKIAPIRYERNLI